MMKCVLILTLLHLCVSVKSNTNLIFEIREGLEKLIANITESNVIFKAPSQSTHAMPHKCLGMFIKELKNLLSKVNVQETNKRYIKELQGNLKVLELNVTHTQTTSCQMIPKHGPKAALRMYKIFFKKLTTKG